MATQVIESGYSPKESGMSSVVSAAQVKVISRLNRSHSPQVHAPPGNGRQPAVPPGVMYSSIW